MTRLYNLPPGKSLEIGIYTFEKLKHKKPATPVKKRVAKPKQKPAVASTKKKFVTPTEITRYGKKYERISSHYNNKNKSLANAVSKSYKDKGYKTVIVPSEGKFGTIYETYCCFEAPKKKPSVTPKKRVVKKKPVKPAKKPVKRGITIKTSDHQTGSSRIKIDKTIKALSPGKRKSASGSIYYEKRKNRSDMVGSRV